ncbi:MAG: hypothetical protein R3C01_09820 [Planctomycetaceae bacterium]
MPVRDYVIFMLLVSLSIPVIILGHLSGATICVPSRRLIVIPIWLFSIAPLIGIALSAYMHEWSPYVFGTILAVLSLGLILGHLRDLVVLPGYQGALIVTTLIALGANFWKYDSLG